MKIKYISLVCFTLLSCNKSSDGSSGGSAEETTGTCQTSSTSHSGCCSSHGGFGTQCSGGKNCYTGSGKLVCNDGTTSPTCVKFMEIPSREDDDPDVFTAVTCT